jgi:hypothetical protein
MQSSITETAARPNLGRGCLPSLKRLFRNLGVVAEPQMLRQMVFTVKSTFRESPTAAERKVVRFKVRRVGIRLHAKHARQGASDGVD